jgi:hypothetical protein
MSHPARNLPVALDHGIPTWNPGQEPKYVYHYTNSAGLKGIIESKALWATDVWYMNDTGEATYSLEAVRRFIASQKPETDESKEFCRRVTEVVDNWTDEANLQNYIACLSENGDQLSQWRSYGSGRGFSIGFDFDALRKLISSNISSKISKVIYDTSAQQAILSDGYQRAEEVLHRRNDTTDQPSDKNAVSPLRAAMGVFFTNFLIKSPSFKHPAFSEEAEVRILITGRFSDGKSTADIKFRESALGITPYVPVPLCLPDEEHISVIRDIIVGPQPHTREVQRAIGQFLAANDLQDVKITPSEVPLRA